MTQKWNELDNTQTDGSDSKLYVEEAGLHEAIPEARFIRGLEIVLDMEGGFVDDPDDRGRRTNYGVTQSTYDRYTGGGKDVKYITAEEVKDVYRTLYWEKGGCDKLPIKLDICHFDWCVNHGVTGAIKTLQKTAGAVSDGILGPNTLKAVNSAVCEDGVDNVVKKYLSIREEWYKWFVASRPTQKKFINGWLNRIDHIANELGVNYKTTRD